MKRVALIALFAFVMAGFLGAQNLAQYTNQPVYDKKVTIAADGTIIPDAHRFGTTVLKSSKLHKTPWWNKETEWIGNIFIDWGYIWAVDTNGLADEAIDGFLFNYSTNDMTDDGVTFGILFWDQATGWNDNLKVQEWGVAFSGLPNHRNNPPTWYSSGWTVTFDLAIEPFSAMFLLDKGNKNTNINDGIEYGLWNLSTDFISPNPAVPACWGFRMSKPDGTASDANFAQNEDDFDIYDVDFNYLGTYWFGGYSPGGAPAANLVWELYAGGPATNTKYGPLAGLKGNDAQLYSVGDWATGGNVHMMMRLNQNTRVPWLCGTIKTDVHYYGGAIDLTRIFPIPVPWRKTMDPFLIAGSNYADFATYDFINMGAAFGTKSIFWQGVITNKFSGGNAAGSDASNNYVKTN